MVKTPRDRGSEEKCQSRKLILFCHRLLVRNFSCRRQPRYLSFSHFSMYCCRNVLPPGLCPIHRGGLQRHPSWETLERAPQNCWPQGPEPPRSATAGKSGPTLCNQPEDNSNMDAVTVNDNPCDHPASNRSKRAAILALGPTSNLCH